MCRKRGLFSERICTVQEEGTVLLCESRVCCAWSACALHDVSVKKVRFIVYGVGSQVKGAYCVSGTTIGRHMDWMYEKGEPAWVALCKIWPLMLCIEWLCRMREPVTLLCTKSVLGNS